MVTAIVIDDSYTVRLLIQSILQVDPAIEILASGADGEQALRLIEIHKPDVVVLDLFLPGLLSGLDVTRKIMEESPRPVIVVTSASKKTAELFDLIGAGAVAVIQTPHGIGHPDHPEEAARLRRAIKTYSQVKLVRRRSSTSGNLSKPALLSSTQSIVAIGASTGGPLVVKSLIDSLSSNFLYPILLTQHIAAGFTDEMIKWFNHSGTIEVKLASASEAVRPGCMYVAPDNRHLGISPDGRIILSDDPAEHGVKPSVSYMFRSVAQSYSKRAIGVLLTGMGADGARELKLIKDCGGRTLAQDSETSVVHGMPGVAIALGAAEIIVSASRLGPVLTELNSRYQRN